MKAALNGWAVVHLLAGAVVDVLPPVVVEVVFELVDDPHAPASATTTARAKPTLRNCFVLFIFSSLTWGATADARRSYPLEPAPR